MVRWTKRQNTNYLNVRFLPYSLSPPDDGVLSLHRIKSEKILKGSSGDRPWMSVLEGETASGMMSSDELTLYRRIRMEADAHIVEVKT